VDYAALKTELKGIADLAESVPEQFRARCFEMLLESLLDSVSGQSRSARDAVSTGEVAEKQPPTVIDKQESAQDSTPIPVKAQLRVFMQRTGVSLDELQRILFVDGTDVHFVREPSHGTVSKGQLEWALLLALKNAVVANEFSADPEDVRSICQDKGFYDKKNFATYFKREPGASYFRQPLQPQGPRQTLTNDGQAALGELVKALAKQTE
jgi:hypothetical protein